MLTVQIVAVGKLKEDYLRKACEEYEKRLRTGCRFSIVEIEEHKLPENPSPAQILVGLEKEGERILEKIPTASFVIPLCIEGKQLDSVELSKKIEETAISGKSHLTFIIGGSFGLWDRVKERGDLRLSMSKMTFPHQIARVMLAEQIYRAFSIQNHSKYHK